MINPYMKIDFRRAIFSPKIPVCVLLIGIALTYGINTTSTLDWAMKMDINSTLIMFSAMVASIPYSASMCEDFEFHFDRQQVVRDNHVSYIFSKMFVTFVTTFTTFLGGFFLAVLYITKTKEYVGQSVVEYAKANDYKTYIKYIIEGKYSMYLLMIGMHLAMFACVMSIIGIVCSLYIKNALFVYVVPVAIMTVENNLVYNMLGYEMAPKYSLYDLAINGITYDGINVKYYYMLCAVLIIILGLMAVNIYSKKRR